jgi:hypothetical protein
MDICQEARTRSFASPALAGFAIITPEILRFWDALSILKST